MSLLLITTLVFANQLEANLQLPDSTCTELLGNCTWYTRCLQAYYPTCDSQEDYPPLGYYFCTRYEQNLHLFSEKAKIFVNRTKLCLQYALLPYVGENGTALTCEQLKQAAFDTHAPCYVNCGFCEISVWDYFSVLKVIAPAFGTEFGELMKEILRILWKCLTGVILYTPGECYGSNSSVGT